MPANNRSGRCRLRAGCGYVRDAQEKCGCRRLDIPIHESMGGGSDVDGPPLPAAVVVATPVGNDGGNGAAAEQATLLLH